MNIGSFLADYSYACNALKQHPMLLEENKAAQFHKLCQNFMDIIYNYDSLVDALIEVTMFFHDGHTNIEVPYSAEDRCLKLPCRWEGEHLVLSESYMDIPVGAEISSIESKPIAEVFSWAERRIPHENKYLVRSRTLEYPYKNYHLFSEMNLERLFGRKDLYSIKFSVNGELIERTCPVVQYDGFLDFSQKPFVEYEIKENTLVLYLRECICNDEYRNMLHRVALVCQEKGLTTLELDLSENMGGSSAVIDEFIGFTHTDEYRRYEMIDFSSGSPVRVSSRDIIVTNQKKDILFPQKIFCRVSNTTFSSARTFAVTLKDNRIATIIGEPIGGRPCSYGMPKRDVTPNCKIKFRVSRAMFLRPDAALEGEEALYPEVQASK